MSLLIPGPRSPGRKIDVTDVDPTIVERPIVRHVTGGFIDDVDKHLSHTDAMFHEFVEDLDNLAEGSLSVGTSQPSATPTPRRRDRYVCAKDIFRLLPYMDERRQIIHRGRQAQPPGSLSIRCSTPLKSFMATITGTSKSTATPRRLVPIRRTY
ncbi:uncharacterized protein E6C27_scaffold468G001260 [Cucumis melo var. makuwa]|uniref:CACTA en-spm transposon protein n=1 Tax=Cucumis melo var. makuwa TaxID=1194695 RepID=A0A5A7VBF2_CUCMM|nr:uncharacterized protein E6C27_scaffold468G001260 [Cucumis melo var. makuwa]